MNELDQLRAEAEQLKNAIRVRFSVQKFRQIKVIAKDFQIFQRIFQRSLIWTNINGVISVSNLSKIFGIELVCNFAFVYMLFDLFWTPFRFHGPNPFLEIEFFLIR